MMNTVLIYIFYSLVCVEFYVVFDRKRVWVESPMLVLFFVSLLKVNVYWLILSLLTDKFFHLGL